MTTEPPVIPQAYGTAFARNTDAVLVGGEPGYELGVTAQPASAAVAPCAGATVTVGACCYVPSSQASQPAEVDLGTIRFNDDSKGISLGTLTFGPLSDGGLGYLTPAIYPVSWNAGDALSIHGAGDASLFPAFDATVPGLLAPGINALSVARAQTLSYTWTPDTNARTMTGSLATSHGQVTCVVPDAAAELTIDGSLTTAFTRGDDVWVTFTRENDRYVEAGSGYLAIAAQGIYEVVGSVQ